MINIRCPGCGKNSNSYGVWLGFGKIRCLSCTEIYDVEDGRETKTIHGQAESVVSLFHVHLDECQQCRENPLGLCPKGEALLINCVSEPMPPEFQRFVSKYFWDLI